MKKFFTPFVLFCILASNASAECRVPQRALFVSVLQEPNVLSSRRAIRELVSFSKNAHVRTLFVQVYRSNQAWFPSSVADDRPYRECVRGAGEDPLSLLIMEAHGEGIQV